MLDVNLKSSHERRAASHGFSLVELMIVVAVLGILAAIVIPDLSGHTTKAKEAAAKENLRLLREAVQRYALEHNDLAPGYPGNNSASTPSSFTVLIQLTKTAHYLTQIPENPFSSTATFTMLDNASSLPAQADGTTAWIYKPSTKTVKLNWAGTDSQGMKYYDY